VSSIPYIFLEYRFGSAAAQEQYYWGGAGAALVGQFYSSPPANVPGSIGANDPWIIATAATPPPMTWNGGSGGTAAGDGGGTWGVGTTNWWNGGAVAWSDGNQAVFGAGTGNGTAGTVSISGVVKPAGILFQTTGDGNAYTLTGGTLDFSGQEQTLTANVNAAINSTIANGGLIKAGTGTLILSGTNTYSGGTFVNDGTLEVTNSNTIAAGTDLTIGDSTAFAPVIPDLSANSPAGSPAPEPGTPTLLGVGALGLLCYVWRRRRS